MHSAWLEPISAVVRVGKQGARHHDEYHFAATVRYIAIDTIEIVGVAKPQCDSPGITKADWVAMVDCFKQSGIRRILFKRIKHGVVREKWLDLEARHKWPS